MRLSARCLLLLLAAGAQAAPSAAGSSVAVVEGELKQWHKVTLTLDGPEASEQGDPNPFLDYRLQVTFRHPASGLTYEVPGYFAADGDAANTSAASGDKWRAHLSPDHPGKWTYRVSFREGAGVAISDDAHAGEPVEGVDGTTGSFSIAKTDKTGRDLRAKGRLQYVGKHHLRFAGSGEYFLKAGADAPENFLAYRGFDGDFKTDGHKDQLVKDWAPHVQDWRDGDPSWRGGKGKGILGAINYLASQGMNVFSFIPLNIEGDDRNVFPYTSYDVRDRIDCSRMDQWEIVFAHGTNRGMYLHFKTQEAENVNLLDGGEMGPQRKLYYRELIARFAHHLALNWNLGEEVGLGHKVSTRKKLAWGEYFRTHDPYHHHIVIHNGNHHYDLLGPDSPLTGFSLQTSQPDFRNVHNRTREYLRRSVEAGKPWVVACDEPGDAQHALITDAENPTHDNARMNALWGNLLAGGAGVEWYFGYKHPHSDLSCQDHRVRENMWKQSKIALDFFADNDIPFWEMSNTNGLVDAPGSYCLSKPGASYLVYLKKGGAASLDLKGAEGVFEILWFNPREGGSLEPGSSQAAPGGGKAMLGHPPRDREQDWLALVRPGDPERSYPPAVSASSVKKAMLPSQKDSVKVKLKGSVQSLAKPEGAVESKWSLVRGAGDVEFGEASGARTDVHLGGAGEYVLRLTATEGGRESHADVKIVVEPFRSTLSALEDFDFVVSGAFAPGYKDRARRAMAINAAQHRDRFAAAESEYAGEAGRFDLVLTTLTETDGESSYRLYVADKKVGEAQNPTAQRDYEAVEHRFAGVVLNPGDRVRVEFNSASNGKVPEGNGFAYSRGRWRLLEFVESPTEP